MGSISYNQVQNNSSNDMRAIFESGEQDLLEKTTDLLIHNQGLEKTDDGKNNCFAQTDSRSKVVCGDSLDTTPHRFFLPQISGIGVENT